MYLKQAIGKYGENKACAYLEKNNYIILCRNFRCNHGEIDIVAKDIIKNELVFIEVKTRLNFEYGRPVDAVNYKKTKHLLSASKYYIYKNHIKNAFIRFDIIEIFPSNYSLKLNHIKQIL